MSDFIDRRHALLPGASPNAARFHADAFDRCDVELLQGLRGKARGAGNASGSLRKSGTERNRHGSRSAQQCPVAGSRNETAWDLNT